jgi:hypothetical protein
MLYIVYLTHFPVFCPVFHFNFSQVTAVGLAAVYPKTWPPCVWLRDFMRAAFPESTKTLRTHSDQLDEFCELMKWPSRKVDEKTNKACSCF